MLRLILTVVLLVLTACGTSDMVPNSQLVQKAIALQLNQTQQQSQQIGFDFKGFKINRVAMTQQEPLTIQDLPAYRVQGTYDITFNLRRRRVNQQQNPFELYLQRQKEGKTWRLALPSKDTPGWRTYLVQ